MADGVVEVMLLGQNVNSYGKTLEHPVTFAGLLKEIEKIEGLERIRFMTSHPKDLSDELIRVMAESKKICRPSASSGAVGQHQDSGNDERGDIQRKDISSWSAVSKKLYRTFL